METAQLDADLTTLSQAKSQWATLVIGDKIAVLEQVRSRTVANA